MGRDRASIVVVEKQWVLHILSVSVALGIQHAMRMRRIVLSPVHCSALQYFPHYLTNGTIFGKKKKMCV